MNIMDEPVIDGTTRRVGYDLLGPVVHRWLLSLDQHIAFFEDGDTKFLFCARAGVRIQRLYELYLRGLGREAGENNSLFWVSRLALCKGTFSRNSPLASEVIARQYRHQPLSTLLSGLFRNIPEALDKFDLSKQELQSREPTFPQWIKGKDPLASHLREYFTECSQAFDRYLEETLQGASRGILIDSGWQGTSQSLLHHAYSEHEWAGLYVGRILTESHDRAITDRVIGLLFQSETYTPSKPETAFTLHRHLFETLLEPNGPSIEEIPGGTFDSVAQAQISANLEEVPDGKRDIHFLLVEEYLRDHAGLGPAEIIARHQAAMPELARILSHPTREEALAAAGKNRSADFGKTLEVPVLITAPDEDRPQHRDSDARIQHALWTQGQIALEYEGGILRELQDRSIGNSDNQSYFDPRGRIEASTGPTLDPSLHEGPLVAIITRTKNRPLLLARAAESVANQTYANYLWVIVNDGGDEQAVRQIIQDCAVDRRKIRLVSNSRSLGMEAASNAGIMRSEGDYLLIHDDDDSLHSRFLEKTVGFLESTAGQRYGGVVTASEYVSEEIRGEKVIEHGRDRYMRWVRNIQLPELMAQNLFPPIAFLYRRSLYDEIGGYNENLPVLGDWFFNVEFLLKADIKVIPEPLAYYHHRDHGDSSRTGVYSNSVIGGQSKHEEFIAVARNEFMRRHGLSNPLATGIIQAFFGAEVRNRIDAIKDKTPTQNASLSIANNSDTEIDRLWIILCLKDIGIKGRFLFRKKIKKEESIDSLKNIIKENNVIIPKNPTFDESEYLRVNKDVSDAITKGELYSGYQHYILFGINEGRERPHKK